MTILEMIKEWRRGCSCGPHNPVNCPDCTTALIDAIESKLIKQNAPPSPLGGEGPTGVNTLMPYLDCVGGEGSKIGLETTKRSR